MWLCKATPKSQNKKTSWYWYRWWICISPLQVRKHERDTNTNPPHDGLSGVVSGIELLVPVGQEGVALAHSFTDQGCVFWAKQPGLAAGCVQVGVGPEEWLVRPRLVPTHQQLGARRLEETSNVSYETDEGQCQCQIGAVQSNQNRQTSWELLFLELMALGLGREGNSCLLFLYWINFI